jgi:hypothetical protein
VHIRRLVEARVLVSMLDSELVPRAISKHQTLRSRGIALGTIDHRHLRVETGAELPAVESVRNHLGIRLVA